MGRLAKMTRAELRKIVEDPESNMLDIMIASIMAKAAAEGDPNRLGMLLDRAIGRVKEQVQIDMPMPTIIRRPNGETVHIGIEQKSLSETSEDDNVLDITTEEDIDESV